MSHFPQRVTRQLFERRFEARQKIQSELQVYHQKINEEKINKVHQETDERAVMRRKAAIQRIADEEYAMAERIYNEQKQREARRQAQMEQDAIATALAEQTRDEIRDAAYRGVLRENDPDIRELKSKLQLALITQTRDNQIRENAVRKIEDEKERIEEENAMMRHYRREEAVRTAEEEAKHQQSLATRAFIQEQLRDKERRRQLLEVAERRRDEKEVAEIVARVQREDQERAEMLREKQRQTYNDMKDFIAAREEMKRRERQELEEEERKIREFSANIDERLARAQDEQKRREAQREVIANKIAADIRKKRQEEDEYEQLCLDLAEQQELQRLADRERAEAEKIRKQIEDARNFMELDFRAKAEAKERSRQEELKLRQVMAEQQRKLNELMEIEQENNRIRIDKFRRELARQLAQKREMFEAARQQELRKLALEQEREEERLRILNEERRKLVVNHIISMGPDAVKYLPKGVLKEEDLDYLPDEYKRAILNLGM